MRRVALLIAAVGVVFAGVAGSALGVAGPRFSVHHE
jgi:hypothetical protein